MKCTPGCKAQFYACLPRSVPAATHHWLMSVNIRRPRWNSPTRASKFDFCEWEPREKACAYLLLLLQAGGSHCTTTVYARTPTPSIAGCAGAIFLMSRRPFSITECVYEAPAPGYDYIACGANVNFTGGAGRKFNLRFLWNTKRALLTWPCWLSAKKAAVKGHNSVPVQITSRSIW